MQLKFPQITASSMELFFFLLQRGHEQQPKLCFAPNLWTIGGTLNLQWGGRCRGFSASVQSQISCSLLCTWKMSCCSVPRGDPHTGREVHSRPVGARGPVHRSGLCHVCGYCTVLHDGETTGHRTIVIDVRSLDRLAPAARCAKLFSNLAIKSSVFETHCKMSLGNEDSKLPRKKKLLMGKIIRETSSTSLFQAH